MARVPTPVLAGVACALLVALADAVDVALTVASGEPTGRIGGTLVRDGVLVAGALMVVLGRGAPWAGWVVVALGALATLRLFAADEPLEYANALGPGAAILLLLPQARAWWAKAASDAAATTS